MSASQSRLLPGRYPAPGTDPIADHIRQRRGERGITPLDANLLHFPAGAKEYNDLLGALRTGGKLPGNLRELMILRIAAHNRAAYEWVQHEPIGRAEGLTTGQLYLTRDIETPLPEVSKVFTPLLRAGLAFVDALTLVGIPGPTSPFSIELGLRYKYELQQWVDASGNAAAAENLAEQTDALYAESTMLVATYNLVSRFLVATDVGRLADSKVPWPLERAEHHVSLPSYPHPGDDRRHSIHAITLRHQSTGLEDIPWLVLSNSLLTNTSLWSWAVPYLLDGGASASSRRCRYNILLHDQRGHGKSTLPPDSTEGDVGYNDDDNARRATIPLLAWDVQNLLVSDEIRRIIDEHQSSSTSGSPTPIHAIIGVSQGGATALAFGAAYPLSPDGQPSDTLQPIRRTKGVIACDTSARTPAGNREAWKERVLAVVGDAGDANARVNHGRKFGLPHLADITLPRWFPAGSSVDAPRSSAVRDMIQGTDIVGFVEGARALGGYDLLVGSEGGINTLDIPKRPPLLGSGIKNVLLLAGSLDGNGKVGHGLKDLQEQWVNSGGLDVVYASIEGSGHLPMIDRPDVWSQVVVDWLSEF